MISVHDNRLLGYSVDCAARRIVLATVYDEGQAHECSDLVFTGVVAYHFEGDAFGTILFDVMEASLRDVCAEYSEVLVRNRDYGWPITGWTSVEQLVATLCERGVKGYFVQSSCGMFGFVLAEQMTVSETR